MTEVNSSAPEKDSVREKVKIALLLSLPIQGAIAVRSFEAGYLESFGVSQSLVELSLTSVAYATFYFALLATVLFAMIQMASLHMLRRKTGKEFAWTHGALLLGMFMGGWIFSDAKNGVLSVLLAMLMMIVSYAWVLLNSRPNAVTNDAHLNEIVERTRIFIRTTLGQVLITCVFVTATSAIANFFGSFSAGTRHTFLLAEGSSNELLIRKYGDVLIFRTWDEKSERFVGPIILRKTPDSGLRLQAIRARPAL